MLISALARVFLEIWDIFKDRNHWIYNTLIDTEGVSGQGGGFQIRRRLSAFQQLTTNKTTAMESTKVGYVYGLTTT